MVLCAFSRIEHVWQLRKCKEKYADSSVLFPFLCLKSNATVFLHAYDPTDQFKRPIRITSSVTHKISFIN